MPERLELLRLWLGRQTAIAGIDARTIEPASGDASFRRYFRVWSGQNSYIVMDAPPAQEDCRPFVRVAQMLAAAGVNVPRIFCTNLDQGFLLLGDLGSETYLQRLNSEIDPDTLYQSAIGALVWLGMLLAKDRCLRFRRGIQRGNNTQALVGGGSSGQQHPQPGQVLEADIQNLNAPRLGGRYNGTDSYGLQLQCRLN